MDKPSPLIVNYDDLSFVIAFPPPFCLADIGILGWAANLHDVVDAPDLRAHERGSTTPLPIEGRHHRGPKSVAPDDVTLYPPVYRLALWYGLWCFITAPLVDFFKSIPVVCTLLSDIVFADIFTSYAKVLGDVWLSLCMLLPSGSLPAPTQDGWYRWILPTLMSVPHLVRFWRCVVEYTGPSNDSRRPLWNVHKYASSFPVIFLSAAQRLVTSDLVAEQAREARDMTWRAHTLPALVFPYTHCNGLRLLVALVNSLCSFWWDVTNDWGFDLSQTTSSVRNLSLPPEVARHRSLSRRPEHYRLPLANAHPHPYGLRPGLPYPLPVYHLALSINLILRLTWSVKLSSHLHARAQGEGSLFIFWLEVAELVRRWVWAFIRFEWEIVRRTQESGLCEAHKSAWRKWGGYGCREL
ncbi:EXS family-domain-containing protein [Lactifluus subvellereus]|nr:EXS family-domain-containing protein [Lactifluus subvellereus]